ncbi:lytic murein transglycosylase B [Rhodoferax sp.]|uniref:lytic murein transglycosylase B n=1 Tax=Rhodoferax sp. TaxID=50421 RepID=UPI0025DA618B|nr:lytic murein transglycosylase B [Rhodoferax sp.]MCM2297011.1 lytic murein transglycosylase B [Rhodoferax sp.]
MLPITATAAKQGKKPVRAATSQAALPGPDYGQRLDAMQTADDIALRHQIDVHRVREVLGQARYVAAIAKAVTPPAVGVAKNWRLYRSRFIEPLRIGAGVAFWQTHRDTLRRAEQETGVPTEIIVGILGVETIYGQQMGNFRVIDALATLAFDFPASHPRATERSAYFRTELEQFLSWTLNSGRDPLTFKGSYAGAMGLPQFMPSSWVKYAVDFDGDGLVDLQNSPADAIGSVANYLKFFNWQPGLPTHFPLSFDESRLDMATLMAPDILPTFSVENFQAKGVVLSGEALKHTGKLALIELQNGDAAPSYVAGTDNFYAITRYNWSSYYALAVIELGQAVAQAMRP